MRPLPEPEIGWCAVELTDAGAADRVLGGLPRGFAAFEWHHYTCNLPAGAVQLARGEAAMQAYRLGDTCWGVQAVAGHHQDALSRPAPLDRAGGAYTRLAMAKATPMRTAAPRAPGASDHQDTSAGVAFRQDGEDHDR